MNSIQVIFPYNQHGVWVFDDARVGLTAEPFVAGASEVIDRLVVGMPDAAAGFTMLFSDQPFPGCQLELEWLAPEYGGNRYRVAATGEECWLCPALNKYFSQAPNRIYVRGEPRRNRQAGSNT